MSKKASVSLLVAILVHDGLEEPEPEYQFAKEYGRKWPFDLCWRFLHLAVEVEGAIWQQGRHTRGQGYQDDCIKYSAASIMGWMLVRVTYGMIEDGSATDLIETAYALRMAQLERGELIPLCPLPMFLRPKARVKQVRGTSRSPRTSPRQAGRTSGQAPAAVRIKPAPTNGSDARLVLLR